MEGNVHKAHENTRLLCLKKYFVYGCSADPLACKPNFLFGFLGKHDKTSSRFEFDSPFSSPATIFAIASGS